VLNAPYNKINTYMDNQEEKDTENTVLRKQRVYVYMLPHRKKMIREVADQLGMSDSTFIICCINFWLQNNNKTIR
jgi:hypothetical protein